MTDYNDGQWHGWNGGDCPVDPDTVVEYVTSEGLHDPEKADDLAWFHDDEGDIIAFRVRRPAPRTIWVVEDSHGNMSGFKSLKEAGIEKDQWVRIEPKSPVTITKFVEARDD